MPRLGRPWTRKEIALLVKGEKNRKTVLTIAKELGRTEESVRHKLRDLSDYAVERLPRERGEMTPEEMERASKLHLADLKRAGHTWWHRIPGAEADTLPVRVPDSTFSHSSCTGSPADMCAAE